MRRHRGLVPGCVGRRERQAPSLALATSEATSITATVVAPPAMVSQCVLIALDNHAGPPFVSFARVAFRPPVSSEYAVR